MIKAAAGSANDNHDESDAVPLEHRPRRFFLALTRHVVGSVPFRLPILKFCAMLGRTVRRAKIVNGKRIETSGLWKEPGHFSSHLSDLT